MCLAVTLARISHHGLNHVANLPRMTAETMIDNLAYTIAPAILSRAAHQGSTGSRPDVRSSVPEPQP